MGDGGGVEFDMGSNGVEWKMVQSPLLGPKGAKGVNCESDEMKESPAVSWEVMTRRGCGRLDIIDV
jgi:hypothetical protein